MKRFEKKGPPAVGTRTGPRARAAQERKFANPYVHAERPARFGPRTEGAPRTEGGPRTQGGPRSAVVTLDPDVARVFRTSEVVNEVLRIVMRLSRFGGSSGFARDRPRPPTERFARGQPREQPRFQRDKPPGPGFRRGRKFESE